MTLGRKYASTAKAYEFLRKKAQDRQAFTVEELSRASVWSESSAKTYISKKLGELLEKQSTGKLRVKQELLRMSEADFLSHMTQVKPVFTEYQRTKHEKLLTYEFLLPLTKEDKLRKSLDDLFFTDTIRRRLNEVGVAQLELMVPRSDGLSDEEFIQEAIRWAQRISGGYSISHASGRFRGSDLRSRKEAGDMLAADRPYLIDETTAIVRFLVPLEAGSCDLDEDLAETVSILERAEPVDPDALAQEVRIARLLFFHLFVEAVARTVEGEDEIWLIEESPEGRRLYRWRRRR